MSTVREILESKKNTKLWSISEDAAVIDAISLMALKNIGALVVMNSDDDLVGLVTERDYARNVILKNRSSNNTLVKEIMNKQNIYVNLDQTTDTCMDLMSRNRIRHLPVVEDEEVIGLVSMGDIVNKIIHDREFLLDQFIYYITGSDQTDTTSFYSHTPLPRMQA